MVYLEVLFREIILAERERGSVFLNCCITVALDKEKCSLKAAVFCQFFPEVSRWEKITNFKVV